MSLSLFYIVATKWLLKQDAIKSITAFVEARAIDVEQDAIESVTSAILVVVREHTRGFRETNVNIMKSIIQLFAALCEFHEALECPFPLWASDSAASVAMQKIADRKLAPNCKSMLSSLCAVSPPHLVMLAMYMSLKSIRAPLAHEETMKWVQSFCTEFGAASLGKGVGELVPWILDVSLPPR